MISYIRWVAFFSVTTGAILGAEQGSGTGATVSAISSALAEEFDRQIAADIAASAPNEYIVRVIDQHGTPAVGVPVWLYGSRYVERPAQAALSGKPGFTTTGRLIPTDTLGLARARYEGQYSMSIGVAPMYVPWPWIMPGMRANGEQGKEFYGVETDIEGEARIRAGKRDPHPKVTTVKVYRGLTPPETLWRSETSIVASDGSGGVFLPEPVLFFPVDRTIPEVAVGRPPSSMDRAAPAWAAYRRAQADVAMPWAHLVMRAGLALSATSGRPLVRHAAEGHEASSWWVELSAGAADLCPVDPVEIYPLTVPNEGYRQALRWEIPAGKDRITSWIWLRFPGSPVRYGTWELVLERTDYSYKDDTAFFNRMEANQPGIQFPEDNNPRITIVPAKITARGVVYINPTGSTRLERALVYSQANKFDQFMQDPTRDDRDKALARALYPVPPKDTRDVVRLPSLTITIPEPPLPPPPIKELTRQEMAETEAMSNEEFDRWMAARTASAAATR